MRPCSPCPAHDANRSMLWDRPAAALPLSAWQPRSHRCFPCPACLSCMAHSNMVGGQPQGGALCAPVCAAPPMHLGLALPYALPPLKVTLTPCVAHRPGVAQPGLPGNDGGVQALLGGRRARAARKPLNPN